MKKISIPFLVFISLWSGFSEAGIFAVTEIRTDEGMVFDGVNGGTKVNPLVPVGLNNVTSYSYSNGSTTQTVTINEHYRSLAGVQGINSVRVFQPSQPASPLYAGTASYLTAGPNGMSLSTGISKAQGDAPDTLRFRVNSMDAGSIGDGLADFFSADIALGHSGDTLRFLNAVGGVLAEYTVAGADWADLGYQQLDRWDISTPKLLKGNKTVPVAGIALELSEFTLSSGVTWADLANDVAELQVGIEDPTKTDYAFLFATDSRTLDITAIPEPSSLAMIGMGSALTLFFRRRFCW